MIEEENLKIDMVNCKVMIRITFNMLVRQGYVINGAKRDTSVENVGNKGSLVRAPGMEHSLQHSGNGDLKGVVPLEHADDLDAVIRGHTGKKLKEEEKN